MVTGLVVMTPLLVLVLLRLSRLLLILLLLVLLLLLLWLLPLLGMLLGLGPPVFHVPSFLHPISSTTTTTTTSLGAGESGIPEVQGVVVHLHYHRPLHHIRLHFSYEIHVTKYIVDFGTKDARTRENLLLNGVQARKVLYDVLVYLFIIFTTL